MNDFETRLKESLNLKNSAPDADSFVADLHSERAKRNSSRNQFLNGIIAGALVVSLGIFTVSQLGTNPAELMVYDTFEMLNEDERVEEEFLTELAVYYLEESDDIWTTVALLDESEFLAEFSEDQL